MLYAHLATLLTMFSLLIVLHLNYTYLKVDLNLSIIQKENIKLIDKISQSHIIMENI